MVSSLSSQEHLSLADNTLRSAAQMMVLLSKNTSPATRAANSSLVTELARPGVIGSIIRETLADRQALAEETPAECHSTSINACRKSTAN